MNTPGFADEVSTVAALAEPLRRELYRYVSAQRQPVGRDQAAEALQIPRHTAKFHLDKLVEEDLLKVRYKRLTGLDGPGAGRPAKLYSRSAREVSVSIPERDYALAAMVMARAIDHAATAGVPILDSVKQAASQIGADLGRRSRVEPANADSADALQRTCRVLESQGYEPIADQDKICLLNCPFHALAVDHTELVCSMNLALLSSLTNETGDGELIAELLPATDGCCVVVSRASTPASALPGARPPL